LRIENEMRSKDTQTTHSILYIMDRQKLQTAYINEVIDEMGVDEALLLLFMYIKKDFDRHSDDILIAEVKNFYPHLMQSV
jgi:hypothetical protein